MPGNALVTGGAGFIGSHLVERLLNEGYTVTALDDLSTGTRANVAHLHAHPRFALIVADVEDAVTLEPLIARADIVYHLAAAVGVRLVVDRPLASMLTNIRGTETVLELASRSGRPVVIASSSEVYGKTAKVPFSEDDDLVLGPTRVTRWSYACSKAIDEFMALAHHRTTGLPVRVVRFFNTVGARQSGRYGMVIPTFVRQALAGEPITVHGDGGQRRTFNHVLDTVDATFRLSLDPDAAGRVFNVGGVAEISILALAELVRERTGSASPIRLVPYDEAFDADAFEDMRRRVPDISRLDAQIGYRPVRTLEDVVDDVVRHATARVPARLEPA